MKEKYRLCNELCVWSSPTDQGVLSRTSPPLHLTFYIVGNLLWLFIVVYIFGKEFRSENLSVHLLRNLFLATSTLDGFYQGPESRPATGHLNTIPITYTIRAGQWASSKGHLQSLGLAKLFTDVNGKGARFD